MTLKCKPTRHLYCVVAAVALAGAQIASGSEVDPDGSRRMLDLYQRWAGEYRIHLGSERDAELTLRREPVYLWTNPARDGGQNGAVFVWTAHQRPHVVGCIFSHPDFGRLKVNHEFHTLSPGVLNVEQPGPNRWQPRAGLAVKPVPNAPVPADTERQRSLQIRVLSRQFRAISRNPITGERWELRLLPSPLYTYRSPESGILNGALLAFVTTAGTDPEVLLLLEARESNSEPHWSYALARFSDLDLHVEHCGDEVWNAARSLQDTTEHDAEHRYRLLVGQEYIKLPAEPEE